MRIKHKSNFQMQKPGADNMTLTSYFVPLTLAKWNYPESSTLDGQVVATRSDGIYGYQKFDGNPIHRLACLSTSTVWLPWMRRCGRKLSLCLPSVGISACQ